MAMASSFCREKVSTSSNVSWSSTALQMLVATRSFQHSDKGRCELPDDLYGTPALKLAPSVRHPPMTASAMPSKPTCSGVFPVMLSMPPAATCVACLRSSG
jgi:predicted YcjX-like family ATPase